MTLPKDWVDSNQLTKNAEVEIETGQNPEAKVPELGATEWKSPLDLGEGPHYSTPGLDR